MENKNTTPKSKADARSRRARFDLGDYYVEDTRNPSILDHHIDLESTARELGALKPDERLDDQ